MISRISSFARSSQGRRLGDQARRFVSKPQNRSKLEGIFGRLTGRSSSKRRAGLAPALAGADRPALERADERCYI